MNEPDVRQPVVKCGEIRCVSLRAPCRQVIWCMDSDHKYTFRQGGVILIDTSHSSDWSHAKKIILLDCIAGSRCLVAAMTTVNMGVTPLVNTATYSAWQLHTKEVFLQSSSLCGLFPICLSLSTFLLYLALAARAPLHSPPQRTN